MTESPKERAKKHLRCVDFGKRQCFKSRLPHKLKARKHGVCELHFCPNCSVDLIDKSQQAGGCATVQFPLLLCALFVRCAPGWFADRKSAAKR